MKFDVASLKNLCVNIQQYWYDNFEYNKAFSETTIQQIKKQDEICVEIDKFTVKTERDRIVFVTQDHPFYDKCKEDKVSNILLQLFQYCNKEEKKEVTMTLMNQLESVINLQSINHSQYT